MAITFDVSAVKLDREPLEDASLAANLEAFGVRDLVAADAGGARLVSALPLNGLVMAMHVAYTRHRPLTLTPDAIWLAIAQGLARHVDAHAEELRPHLVRHQGKLELEARCDELSGNPGSAQLWSLAVGDLVAMVREHLGGRADLFVADFSTTDACSRVASQITLLGAMQSYFDYVVSTFCGIPKITLEGTPNDWCKIRERVRVFGEFDLGGWGAALDPVLAELEATSRGKPSRAFWKNAYKLHQASGGEEISGWVNALFPYLYNQGTTPNPWLMKRGRTFPKLGYYPNGLCGTPFTWRLFGNDKPMHLLAGFVGVARAGNDGVAPAIGWAVAPPVPEQRFAVCHRFGSTVPLAPRTPTSLTSLEGLAEELTAGRHSDATLELIDCHALQSLEGIAAADASRKLMLLRCERLESLEALAAAPLGELLIHNCSRVSDIRPIAAMPRLRRLALVNCPAITDYRPLAALGDLEWLDLRGEGVPEPIHGRHTTPEAIAAVRRFLAG